MFAVRQDKISQSDIEVYFDAIGERRHHLKQIRRYFL